MNIQERKARGPGVGPRASSRCRCESEDVETADEAEAVPVRVAYLLASLSAGVGLRTFWASVVALTPFIGFDDDIVVSCPEAHAPSSFGRG